MNFQEVSKQVRQLIGQANIAAALESLLQFLQQSPQHKTFMGVVLNIQSVYHRTRQKELRGTLTQEQATAKYNLVNDSLMQVLDQLDSGETSPKGFNAKAKRKRQQAWMLALTTVIALAVVGILFVFLRNDDRVDTQCPGFATPSELNVLLLPFLNLSEGGLKPEYAIKDRLEKYCGDYQVSTQVRVFDAYYLRPQAELPDFNLAGDISSECEAGLIVWGTVERLANDRIDMTTKFKFLGANDEFALQKIQFEGETQVDTILSVSSIGRQGNITKDIEELVLTLFGLVAHKQGHHEAAIATLEQTLAAKGADTANVLLTQMILADSYLATEQPEKAAKSYDRVLEVDPNHNLARNNRGYLLLKDQKLNEAVLDFSNILERQPDDKEALLARTAIYSELKERQKAETDFQKVRTIDPDVKFPVLKKVETFREFRRE